MFKVEVISILLFFSHPLALWLFLCGGLFQRKYPFFIRTVYWVLFSTILSRFLKNMIQQPLPLTASHADWGMPSGHTLAMVCCYGNIALSMSSLWRRIYIAIILSSSTAIVLAGFHTPEQVLAALLLGFCLILTDQYLFTRYHSVQLWFSPVIFSIALVLWFATPLSGDTIRLHASALALGGIFALLLHEQLNTAYQISPVTASRFEIMIFLIYFTATYAFLDRMIHLLVLSRIEDFHLSISLSVLAFSLLWQYYPRKITSNFQPTID